VTLAPASANARTNSRWLGGKKGSTNTTFTRDTLLPEPACRLMGCAARPVAVRSMAMVVAAFVAPFLLDATARFVDSAARLPGVRLGLITTVPSSQLPPELKKHIAAHWQVDDALDPQQIADAVRGLSAQLGRVDRLVGALEQLQVPLAEVRDALGIEGMGEATAQNVRDKSRMKSVLRAAGVPCARHQLVHHTQEALDFALEVGFPLVAKPPAGAGAQATYRLDDQASLDGWLASARSN